MQFSDISMLKPIPVEINELLLDHIWFCQGKKKLSVATERKLWSVN